MTSIRSMSRSRGCLAASMTLVAVSAAAGMGPLDPPAGPPTSTMKRLDQIESRRVLNDLPGSAEAVCVVSQPGQYYLTRDLQGVQGKHGIFVTCPDVSIDLEGFSLDGVPGSLDGVHVSYGGGGGSGSFVFAGRKGYQYYKAQSDMASAGRGIHHWGDRAVFIDGPDQVSISGVVADSCGGQGFVCLHASGVIHRDLAARNCLLGGIYIEGPTSSSNAARGPRQTVSLDGAFVADCGGDCVRIVSPTSGACDVTCSNVSGQDGTGKGLKVKNMGVVKGTVVINNANFRTMGGNGIDVGGSGTAGSHWEVRMSHLHVDQCGADGIVADDCDIISVRDSTISDCAGDGLRSYRPGRPVFGNITLERCTGSGLACQDLDALECDGVFAADCGGYGVSALRAGKCKYKNIVLKRCASGGVRVEQCDDGRCEDLSVSDCPGSGASFSRVRALHLQMVSVSACDQNGIVIADCDQDGLDDVLVSSCGGAGVLYAWTSSTAVGSRVIQVQHRRCVVRDCLADACSFTCPPGSSSVDIDMDSCSFLSCGGHGCVVAGTSPDCNLRLTSSQPKIVENQKGLLVSFHPAAPVSLQIRGADISGNRDDGLSVVSSNPAVSLRGGGSVSCSHCTFSRNGGSGCVSESPLYADHCTVGENVLYGVRCVAADSFTLACTTVDCVMQRNGAACLRCGPGRYSDSGSQFSDGLAEGVVVDSGCCLLTNSTITRCALDGVSVHGTLTVQGGASRRNGQWGYRCADGSCVARDCSAELNGAGSSAGLVGGGMSFTDCSAVTLQHCVCSSNFGDGFACSSSSFPVKWTAPECLSSSNSGDGFHLADCSSSMLDRCCASGNGGLGLRATATFSDGTIRDFVASGNGGGIQIAGHGNLVTRCSSTSGTLGGIQIAPQNSVGATVDGAVLPQRCNPNDNILH